MWIRYGGGINNVDHVNQIELRINSQHRIPYCLSIYVDKYSYPEIIEKESDMEQRRTELENLICKDKNMWVKFKNSMININNILRFYKYEKDGTYDIKLLLVQGMDIIETYYEKSEVEARYKQLQELICKDGLCG